MPTKTGAGGAQQEYDESTGRYGGGEGSSNAKYYTGKGTQFRSNASYQDIMNDSVPVTDEEYNKYKIPKEPIQRKPEHAEKWAKYDSDYALYKAEEPNISATVEEISREVGLPLIGREYSLKGKESYDRKVNDKRINGEYKPIGDAVRYTFEHKLQNAPEDIRKTLAIFKEKGYNIVAVDNKWKVDGPYKGINVDIVSPTGIPMEVQFMTYKNHEIKQAMHPHYEKSRDSRMPANIKAKAQEKMDELAKLWEIPDRITEV